jgi:hypothetical protein
MLEKRLKRTVPLKLKNDAQLIIDSAVEITEGGKDGDGIVTELQR